MLKKGIFFLFAFFVCSLKGQTEIKTMFYNTLNYNSDTESKDRTHHLKTILNDVRPDLFMICELKNEDASNYLYDNAVLPYNNNFSKVSFKYSESPATGLLQMAYYNNKKLTLISEEVIPTRIRDINHYTFQINTKKAEFNPIIIEVFVTHLKASRGNDNMQKRLESTEIFTRELDRLPTDSFVLFAGDFNFYTSNEPAFQKLIDASNSIRIIDPVNRICPTFPDNGIDYFDENNYNSTYFWNNSSFADVHSQSTRTFQVNGDGAGGGMDDRFDFIMMSENFNTSSTLYYVNNSYKSVGNNGNCYNSYVSNTDCSGEFSQDLRNALQQFSDHLPIVMSLETPQNTLSILKKDYSILFLNSNIAKNSLSIQMKEKVGLIKIYNQLGQTVYKIKNVNQKELKIYTNTFSKGIYYLIADTYKPLKFLKI